LHIDDDEHNGGNTGVTQEDTFHYDDYDSGKDVPSLYIYHTYDSQYGEDQN
jgi:hypothetical protein